MEKDIMKRELDKIIYHLNCEVSGAGITDFVHGEFLKNQVAVVRFDYACYSEHGYFDGYATCSVQIKLWDLDDFRVVFHGRDSSHKNAKYNIREYLEDSLMYGLTSYWEKNYAD